MVLGPVEEAVQSSHSYQQTIAFVEVTFDVVALMGQSQARRIYHAITATL